MARELNEIYQEITSTFIADPTIQQKYDLTLGNTFDQEFSKVSIERILFNVIAFAILALEVLQDYFQIDIQNEMAKQKIHSKQWYRQKALDFQYGFSVIDGTDLFDNTGYTEQEIEASKIIKQAACVKMISSSGYGILRVKCAKENSDGYLAPLDSLEYEAVKYYFMRYATDAGTQLKVTTNQPDDLKLRIHIYYDPLVLNPTGARLDGSDNNPVEKAISSFLKSIDFNGALVLSDLVAFLRRIEGVRVANVQEAASKYGQYTYTTTNIPNAGVINEIRVADSGYMRIDELTIDYIVMPE